MVRQSYHPNTTRSKRISWKKLLEKSIAAIQTDTQARKKLSSDYANDTGQLSASANVIAIKVQIIDQANNYWKNEK
ncbi:MAG: hypothetical protein KA290_03350 [Chitinophagaceae bacterium]|nr:hypothetical protein [Chitinophagaceae bacterium]